MLPRNESWNSQQFFYNNSGNPSKKNPTRLEKIHYCFICTLDLLDISDAARRNKRLHSTEDPDTSWSTRSDTIGARWHFAPQHACHPRRRGFLSIYPLGLLTVEKKPRWHKIVHADDLLKVRESALAAFRRHKHVQRRSVEKGRVWCATRWSCARISSLTTFRFHSCNIVECSSWFLSLRTRVHVIDSKFH